MHGLRTEMRRVASLRFRFLLFAVPELLKIVT
jgi:hypothetical protein